jgi:hypothetical protein
MCGKKRQPPVQRWSIYQVDAAVGDLMHDHVLASMPAQALRAEARVVVEYPRA